MTLADDVILGFLNAAMTSYETNESTLYLFAFIGLIVVLNAAFKGGVNVIYATILFLVVTPALIIKGLVNKKSRQGMIDELRDIRNHFKENPESWIILGGTIGLILLVFIIGIAINYI